MIAIKILCMLKNYILFLSWQCNKCSHSQFFFKMHKYMSCSSRKCCSEWLITINALSYAISFCILVSILEYTQILSDLIFGFVVNLVRRGRTQLMIIRVFLQSYIMPSRYNSDQNISFIHSLKWCCWIQ